MEQVIGERVEGTPRLDRSLIASARAGDRDAFEALLGRHLEPTFRTVLAILGSEADARDATQEIFISVWRELPHLRDADRFEAWLGRITVNTCRHSLRSRGRRRIREIAVADSNLSESVAIGSHTTGFADEAAETDLLARAFDRLAVDARALLVLHYQEERPLAEIGALLGVPVGTVKSRLSAARQALERALEVESR